MDWDSIKGNGCINIGDSQYDVSHLRDVVIPVTIEASGNKARIDANILVQYSSHVTSVGDKYNKRLDFSEVGRDHLIIDERGWDRMFNLERYELSKKLPEILSDFPNRRFIYTGTPNFLLVEFIGDNGERIEYEIYFNLNRQGGILLRLYIRSAYIRDEEHEYKRINMRDRRYVKAKTLISKRFRNEPLHKPRR